MLKIHYTLLASLLLCVFIGTSQNITYSTVITKDGIVVKSNVRDTLLGETKRQLIEYTVSKTIDANYLACVNVYKNISNFSKLFEYTKKSEKIRQLSENECVVYFYMDMPWPMADSDAVYKMTLVEDENTAQFKMICAPDLMDYAKVKRAMEGTSLYYVEKKEQGQVLLKIHTRSVPASDSPDWMIEAWFPEGPAQMIRNVEELALKR